MAAVTSLIKTPINVIKLSNFIKYPFEMNMTAYLSLALQRAARYYEMGGQIWVLRVCDHAEDSQQ